jgi:hypothetical protein
MPAPGTDHRAAAIKYQSLAEDAYRQARTSFSEGDFSSAIFFQLIGANFSENARYHLDLLFRKMKKRKSFVHPVHPLSIVT